ncbi:MAG: crossover junction endodeoxyribonuclease RuvC [candidate division Zixibacteria bacterium]|nr:crossover junction endodeoxyribonuclease RuvC [candidate division Zixibacteria bacterium]
MGIDPGTDITGYGIVRCNGAAELLVEAGIIRGGKGELHEKLNSIYKELVGIISEFHPSRIAIEQLYAHYKHPRTSIIMGHARGVIMLAASQAGLEISSYPATEIKKTISGNGRASKEKLSRIITEIFNLEKQPDYLDISDALAVALTDIRHQSIKPTALVSNTRNSGRK